MLTHLELAQLVMLLAQRISSDGGRGGSLLAAIDLGRAFGRTALGRVIVGLGLLVTG